MQNDHMTEPLNPSSRPVLGVGAVIWNDDGDVLLIQRGKPPRLGQWSIPGGHVEWGESLRDALIREVREETGMAIEPLGLAGFRETIVRDPENRVERHFVILPFAARWVAGEPCLNEELSEACWIELAEVAALPTTPGLTAIVATALEQLQKM